MTHREQVLWGLAQYPPMMTKKGVERLYTYISIKGDYPIVRVQQVTPLPDKLEEHFKILTNVTFDVEGTYLDQSIFVPVKILYDDKFYNAEVIPKILERLNHVD